MGQDKSVLAMNLPTGRLVRDFLHKIEYNIAADGSCKSKHLSPQEDTGAQFMNATKVNFHTVHLLSDNLYLALNASMSLRFNYFLLPLHLDNMKTKLKQNLVHNVKSFKSEWLISNSRYKNKMTTVG